MSDNTTPTPPDAATLVRLANTDEWTREESRMLQSHCQSNWEPRITALARRIQRKARK